MKFFNLSFALVLASALVACEAKRNPYFENEDSQFILSSVSAKSAPTSQSELTNETNRITYNFDACLADLTGASVPPKLKFAVKIGNESQIVTTNRLGCIQWPQVIGFNPLVKDKYYVLTFVITGHNELGGQMNVDVAVNPWLDDVVNLNDKQNKKLEGIQLERYEAQGFVITNISSSGSSTRPNSTDINTSVIPQSNVIPNQGVALRMRVNSVTIELEKRNEDAPFTVDQNLDLYVHKVYKFTSDIKFFKQTSQNLHKEVVPVGGRYRVTLAILNEPNFDVPTLWDDLKAVTSTDEIIQGKGKSKSFAAMATVLEQDPTLATNRMTINQKRELIAKTMLQYVHQTTSFELDVTPEEGFKKGSLPLTVKQLELANTRAVLAVTIQPLTEDIGHLIKTDGSAYIKSIGEPGSVTLNTWPIEADLIHAERIAAENKKKALKPLELFFQASYVKAEQQRLPRDRAFQPLDKKDLPANQNPVALNQVYPFEKELDKYLSNEWTLQPNPRGGVLPSNHAVKVRAAIRGFQQALCVKAFYNAHIRNISDQKKMELAMVCANTAGNGWIAINKLDFVDDEGMKPAQIMGLPMIDKLSVGRSLSLGLSNSTSYGWKFDGSASGSLSAGTGDMFGPVGFNFSVGPSVFYSTGQTVSKSNGSSASLASSIDFSVESSTFRFERNTRKCIAITYTDRAKEQLKKANASVHEGFLTCSATNVAPRQYEETYYIITQACPSDSQIADCKSSRENVIRLMIRGKKFYKHFETMVRSTDLGLLLEKVPHDALQNYVKGLGPQLKTYNSNQVAPGVVPASQEKPQQ